MAASSSQAAEVAKGALEDPAGRKQQPGEPVAYVPVQYYQSGPVSCALVLLTSLITEMQISGMVKAKSLGEYTSGAVGHSQGLATAATLSFVRFAVQAVWALFRQGLRVQEAAGLRDFRFDSVGKLTRSNMVSLRGKPNAFLQYSALRDAPCSLINSEDAVVCSGRPADRFVEKLEASRKAISYKVRPLPIPMPLHSPELIPAMVALMEELRCTGFMERKVAPKLRIYPFTPGQNVKPRRPLDLWRLVVARQLTMACDFPAMVAQAAAGIEVTHAIDMGPTDNSVVARLLSDADCSFPIIPAVASPQLSVQALAEPLAFAGVTLLKRVEAVAAEVLQIPTISGKTLLAEAGVTSQALGALRSRLQEVVPECTGRLPVAKFYAAPTLLAIAELATDGLAASQDQPPVEPLPPIVHVSVYANRGTTYPLSFGQEQMLRVQTMSPSCVAYNVSASVWIAGGVHTGRVRASLQAILARHEVFSGLAMHSPLGLRLLALMPQVNIVQVPDEAAALARMGEIGRTPFRLAEESSVRCEVLSCPSGLVLVAFWVHHMNFDILSQGILHRELRTLLSAREATLERAVARLPELPVQFVDYSIWSRQCVESGHFDAAPVVANLVPHVSKALDLPVDRPRPRTWSFQGDRVVTRLPEGLKLLHKGTTPFVAFLTAFYIQLWKSSGQEAVVVGVPYHGRDLSAVQPLCGYFINMLPIVGHASTQTTVASALVQTQERWQQAMEHAQVPFLHVVDSLNKQFMQPDPSRNSVFQAMLNYRAETMKPMSDPRFRVQQVHQLEGHMDLDVQIDAGETGIVITHNYCTSLFEPRTAERFAAQYLAALRAISLEEWQHIQTWRVPAAPRLLEDIKEAKAISLEYSAQKLTPLLEEMQRPVVVGGPAGLRVLP